MLIGDMQHPRGVEFLAGLVHDADRLVSREAARSLLRIGNEPAILVLVGALSAREETALVAARCLGATRSRTALRALISAASEKGGHSEAVRLEAIRGLGRMGHDASVELLVTLLDSRGLLRRKTARPIRLAAAHALGRIGGVRASGALHANAGRGDPAVREACREALQVIER